MPEAIAPSTPATPSAAAPAAPAPPAPAAPATPPGQSPAPGQAPESGASAPKPAETQKPDPTKPEPEKKASDAWGKIAAAQKKLEADRAAHKKTTEQLEKDYAPLRKAAELMKAGKHLEALEAMGGSYAALTEQAVKRPKPNAEAQQALSEVEKLRKEIEERDAKDAAAAEQAQIADFKSTIPAAIAAKDEKGEPRFEVLAALGDEGVEHVFNLIRQHAYLSSKDGGEPELLTPEQAASILEEKLTERLRKLVALKKLQAATTAAPTTPAKPSSPHETRGDPADADGPRSLGNGHASQVATRATPPAEPLPGSGQAKRRAERDAITRAAAKLSAKK